MKYRSGNGRLAQGKAAVVRRHVPMQKDLESSAAQLVAQVLDVPAEQLNCTPK